MAKTVWSLQTVEPQNTRGWFNKARQKAFASVMRGWYFKFLPRHFESGAEQRYGLPRREPKYIKRKLKRYGHAKPLVYSGRLFSRIRGQKPKPQTASRSGTARLPIPVPWYGRVRQKSRARLDIQILEVIQSEASQMAAWLADGIQKGWDGHLKKKTLR